MRKVPTASGATAVQIADKTGGKYRIVEHLGSAHTPEDLAALVEAGKAKLAKAELGGGPTFEYLKLWGPPDRAVGDHRYCLWGPAAVDLGATGRPSAHRHGFKAACSLML
ncbi:hypothetical protein CIK79_10520 [Brevibacterium aurantiacum]|uniref:Uncharacterized protein n=1 Tax=Brevibacterium aurantiacum TaxID=273384 RepID=A0A2A3X4R0_BREAU|nr:hypothetical protein CIK79_10520 [Brevibacterium aurantiacum]